MSAEAAPDSSCRSVPVEHLDYSFIQSCSDLKHLEQILRVLRSGQEGFYPHLIEFCERHIEKLDPKSRVLRKENRAATAACFSTEEWRNISEDLQMWERNIRADEAEMKRSAIFSDVENVPPVRSSNGLVQRSSSATVKTVRESCGPRSYRDWDRFDVEAEVSKIDESHTNTLRPDLPSVQQTVSSSSALTAQEKDVLARREKDKGNEAFRSGDYEEAVAYYSRSVSLASSAAAFNNRAQAHIKLQRWSAALSDCETVLQLEPENIKALLRRATVHKHLGHLQESHDDLRAVLLMEPHNSTALKLLTDETEQCQERRSTGRKILIQEVDDDAQDEGRQKRDVSEAESGIMGNTHKMASCTNMQTDGPNRLTDISSDDASAGAPPPGHAHMKNDEITLLENRDEKHIQAAAEAVEERLVVPEFERLKDEGSGLFRSGCYQEAADRYTECLQLKPHECAVYTNRALCYIKLQRFNEARQDCDSALQLQPTNKKAFYRRALANKGLKDYLACRSDLQQVLRLDTSVTEAEQLLMEVTHLMKDRHPSGARRTVHITEVDDDDDDEDQVSSADGADGRSIIPQPCNAYEFGQALTAARSQDDLLTCAELLRSVTSDRLPRFIGSQLDAQTVSFIIRALHTHLLHTHPELVYGHLQQLHNTHRLTMVLMMLGRDERTQLSQLFQNLRSVQTEAFSQNDITNLANKYL
ncbi:sperm-associated antigen 1 [Ctenopharyngodon idella]|uniref:sperm-associated antigen 1 n=1 Tax=Ctenopharyngodon idella TaxID=7959 RepID=UPI00222E9FF7|nr:sperm-associated antigen 1 [Ctenopharyngodon idella]XP_051721943.1 sperm-associated antigen 1 [Ctenopharyngodon idella]